MEEKYKSFHQEEEIIVVQAIIDHLFEEALGFRVSSEYRGGHGATEEE
jgi:superfamily I DNA and/or RNA helicase